MKTVKNIAEEIAKYNDWESTKTILREWANDIIEACAGSAEYSMERCIEGEWYDTMYEDEDGEYVHPVLHRGSMLEVKNKL